MPLQRLDPTTSRPSCDTAGTVLPSLRPISSGLSSTPSQLQSSARESAHDFDDDCILDCLENCIVSVDSFFQECLGFIKRLFPCFFSSEASFVEEEPLFTAVLDQRVDILKKHVADQLQVLEVPPFPSKTDSLKLGIYPDIVNGGRVAVLLKYDNLLAFCSKDLNGLRSLEELKSATGRTIEEFVHHSDTREAQTAVFSITTIAMTNLQMVSGEITSTHQRQTCHVNFTPNDRGNPTGRFDFRYNLPCIKEIFMLMIKQYTTSQEIDPARSDFIEKELVGFFAHSLY